MKKAFTLIELIFVIVLIGILAVSATSRFTNDTLQTAADQIINHIRYTQHLAMTDDKYRPSAALSEFNGAGATNNAQSWYKSRWQLRFSNTATGSGGRWAYTIYSDQPGTTTNDYDGKPGLNEIAVDPHDATKLMSGGYATIVAEGDANRNETMDLGQTYDITGVAFTGGCASGTTQMFISFEHDGTPMFRNPNLLDDRYKDGANNRIIQSTCTITLTHSSGETMNIFVEPYTGYAHQ